MTIVALCCLVVITAGWWALALWPVAGSAPEWLDRARWVCFNARPEALPDASGWILLVGQPVGMLAVLLAGWGERVRRDLRVLATRPAGRLSLGLAAGLLALGLAAAGVRIAGVSRLEPATLAAAEAPPDTYPRIDRDAPELGLVAQSGERIGLGRLRGRPALVTFAFAHCESVCPLVVHEALDAQRRLRESAEAGRVTPERVPRVVVVTLDPWRDTPSRLPHLARAWGLGDEDFALSGDVEEVNALLDRWGVARERNTATGDVTHPPLVYVLDPEGRIAFAASGASTTLVALVERS